MKSTGNNIQTRREDLGLTRSELAKRLKTTKLRLWRIETGKTKVDADELRHFANALKTTVEALVA